MGIQGLLPLLKDIQVKTHVSNFKGQAVGIDTYCWLHKGTYGCAKDLILGKPTRGYVLYVMRRVHMLINHGVKPILVFDGGYLPAKGDKEKERRGQRSEYKKRGLQALRDGNNQVAFECFQKACDVTPKMAAEVIKECYTLGVQCIVAPYEADAQLAYLMKQNITQFTISEDSDLLLYGCNRVLYKMTAEGEGLLVDLEHLCRVRSVQLSSFTFSTFRHMCMLSGCDYLPSVKGFGLKKSYQALKKHGTVTQCIRFMKCDRMYTVPIDYEERFLKAELVFKYQLVFDPKQRKVVPLNEVDETEDLSVEYLSYAGPPLDDSKALSIALGNIDPISGEQIGMLPDFATERVLQAKSSSWLSTSKPRVNEKSAFQYSERKKLLPSTVPSSSPIDSSSDCTPPVSNECYVADKVLAKRLDDIMPKLKSPEAEASKSLRRLELQKQGSRRDSEKAVMSLKKLYTNDESKPASESKSLTLRHHSVFTKKKPGHKFRNPFRLSETDASPKVAVKSRYFGGSNSEEESKHSPTCAPPSPTCSPPSPQMINSSPKNEPLMFASISPKAPTKESFNGSFIDYLDCNNLSASTKPKKRLTLSDSPQKCAKQRKLDTIITHKVTKELCEDTFIEERDSKNNSINHIDSPSNVRKPLSPINDNTGPSIDFNITNSEVAELLITSTKAEENINKIHTIDLDEQPMIIKPNLAKGKIKLGLSKLNRKTTDTQEKIDSLPKLTFALDKFMNTSKDKILFDSKSQHESKKDADIEIIYSDEEEVLPKKLTSKKCPFKPNQEKKKVLLERCKPIGLTKKRRTNISKKSTNDNLKQTKLTLDKFKFANKASVL